MRLTALLIIVMSFFEIIFEGGNSHLPNPTNSTGALLSLSEFTLDHSGTMPVSEHSVPISEGVHFCYLGHCPATISDEKMPLISPRPGTLLVHGYMEPSLSADCESLFRPPRA